MTDIKKGYGDEATWGSFYDHPADPRNNRDKPSEAETIADRMTAELLVDSDLLMDRFNEGAFAQCALSEFCVALCEAMVAASAPVITSETTDKALAAVEAAIAMVQVTHYAMALEEVESGF